MVKKIAGTILCIVLVVIMLGTSVFAHELNSEFSPNPGVNEGVVEFFFDNYELASFIEVRVFNTQGVEIYVGRTDGMGRFDFSSFEHVGHLRGRYDDEHIQIHVVAQGQGYIIGKDFGGTYVPYEQIGDLLSNFVWSRFLLNIFVWAIPGGVLAVSVIFFVVKMRLAKPKQGGEQNA